MCLLELATMEYPYAECKNAAQIYKKVTSVSMHTDCWDSWDQPQKARLPVNDTVGALLCPLTSLGQTVS
jgi:hypothetical protein